MLKCRLFRNFSQGGKEKFGDDDDNKRSRETVNNEASRE